MIACYLCCLRDEGADNEYKGRNSYKWCLSSLRWARGWESTILESLPMLSSGDGDGKREIIVGVVGRNGIPWIVSHMLWGTINRLWTVIGCNWWDQEWPFFSPNSGLVIANGLIGNITSVVTLSCELTGPESLLSGIVDLFHTTNAVGRWNIEYFQCDRLQWSRQYLYGEFWCNISFPGSRPLSRVHYSAFQHRTVLMAGENRRQAFLRSEVDQICFRSAGSLFWDFSPRLLSFMRFHIAVFGYIVLCIVSLTYSKPNLLSWKWMQAKILPWWASARQI